MKADFADKPQTRGKEIDSHACLILSICLYNCARTRTHTHTHYIFMFDITFYVKDSTTSLNVDLLFLGRCYYLVARLKRVIS